MEFLSFHGRPSVVTRGFLNIATPASGLPPIDVAIQECDPLDSRPWVLEGFDDADIASSCACCPSLPLRSHVVSNHLRE